MKQQCALDVKSEMRWVLTVSEFWNRNGKLRVTSHWNNDSRELHQWTYQNFIDNVEALYFEIVFDRYFFAIKNTRTTIFHSLSRSPALFIVALITYYDHRKSKSKISYNVILQSHAFRDATANLVIHITALYFINSQRGLE